MLLLFQRHVTVSKTGINAHLYDKRTKRGIQHKFIVIILKHPNPNIIKALNSRANHALSASMLSLPD